EGMFALAVWDARAERLVLAGDLMGGKPLHYAAPGRLFLFASEPEAILPTRVVSALGDPLPLASYPRTRLVGATHRRHRPRARRDPGTRRGRDRHGRPLGTLRERAPLRAEPTLPVDLDTAARGLRVELEHAVDAPLVSDVPVGVFLSGGLDSSSVAAIARQR